MWILPKNYPLYSHFAQDMVESKEDLNWLEFAIKHSLMWRSKPSPLPTWLRRWNRVSWLQRLFGQTLKPCQWKSFETKFQSLLEATHVNPSHRMAHAKDLKIPKDGISGLTSTTLSPESDLPDVSLKMSQVISPLDSKKLSETWEDLVTLQRGEYSQRLKKEQVTTAKEFLYWPTPDVAQAQKVSNRPNYGQLGLANHPAVHGKKVNRPPMKKDRLGLSGQEKTSIAGKNQEQFGKLNPNWVEQLMGLPIGWTALDSWEME